MAEDADSYSADEQDFTKPQVVSRRPLFLKKKGLWVVTTRLKLNNHTDAPRGS